MAELRNKTVPPVNNRYPNDLALGVGRSPARREGREHDDRRHDQVDREPPDAPDFTTRTSQTIAK